MTTRLYGIKNCDTVKKARQWLENNKLAYVFHDFRVDGIDEGKVNEWLEKSSLEALINKRSTTWKNLDEASKNSLTNDNAAALCVKYETLIKRPVLEYGNDIHLGFNEKLYSRIFNA